MADIEYCEWMTGFPIKFYNFIASFETNGAAVEFYSNAPVEVDWGGGKYVSYDSGAIHGYQTNTNSGIPVIIRSSEVVTEFRFGSGISYDNGYLECHINKAFDLISANKLCYRLESMHTFSFFGTNKVKDFSSAWEDCTELIEFNGMDTIEAVSFYRAWKNCNKLINFPSIYSRVANTVEEAWMGCTSMVEFPIIGSELCTSFKNAWRGNTKLSDFPLIDTSVGTDFSGAWAYCVSLVSFPQLDFSSALTMNKSFAYNYKIQSLPFFNTEVSTDFGGMFERNLALECIGGIDTRSIGSTLGVLNSVNMFKDDCLLVNPNTTEQAELMVGSYYQNTNDCYFDAGRSIFYTRAISTSSTLSDGEYCVEKNPILCSLEVTGGDFEVDWGDGIFLPYNEGEVTGLPISTGIINIRSEENITSIKFTSDTYVDISMKRAKTVTSFEETAMNITKLLTFSMYGVINATNFNSMLEGCTSLEVIKSIDLSTALTLNATFKNCHNLFVFSDTTLDMALCTDFTETFYACRSLSQLGTLITTSGELFTDTFNDASGISCIYGIDTRNQTNTAGMFDGTTSLSRPNSNEVPLILDGMLYSNGGNCTASFNISFISNGAVQFTVDTDVEVDWGNGIYVTESAGIVTGTPTGQVFVFGNATSVTFDTDTFVNVTFYNTEYITDMTSMFEGLLSLETFKFIGSPNVTTWNSAFKGCTSLETYYCSGFEVATVFTSMFENCTSLTDVDYMNTLVGTEFGYMFASCTLLDLKEINTKNGNFAKQYIDCVPKFFDCVADSLICDPTHLGGTEDDVYQCSVFWDCRTPALGGDEFACFGSSTMFENWLIGQIPTEADRIAISSKAHWKDGELL